MPVRSDDQQIGFPARGFLHERLRRIPFEDDRGHRDGRQSRQPALRRADALGRSASILLERGEMRRGGEVRQERLRPAPPAADEDAEVAELTAGGRCA